jgi:hypothetical protein
MMDDSDFDESSYFSSSESGDTTPSAKRLRKFLDPEIQIINNDDISPLLSSSSSPAASPPNANNLVAWARSRGKSGQFLGCNEVEVRVGMTLDKVCCVSNRMAIITRQSRNEIYGISPSSDDDAEELFNGMTSATFPRRTKAPPP